MRHPRRWQRNPFQGERLPWPSSSRLERTSHGFYQSQSLLAPAHSDGGGAGQWPGPGDQAGDRAGCRPGRSSRSGRAGPGLPDLPGTDQHRHAGHPGRGPDPHRPPVVPSSTKRSSRGTPWALGSGSGSCRAAVLRPVWQAVPRRFRRPTWRSGASSSCCISAGTP